MNTAINTVSASRRTRGFTLVEFMAVLAIVSILAGIAVPSFKEFTTGIRIASASDSFVAGLQLARSESIKRNKRVVMCKSSDGSSCATEGDWDQGWIVFEDADDDTNRSPSEALILQSAALNASIKVAGNATVARYVSFAPMGGTRLASGGFQAGTITVCKRESTASAGRQIVLNAVGRPRVQKASIAIC